MVLQGDLHNIGCPHGQIVIVSSHIFQLTKMCGHGTRREEGAKENQRPGACIPYRTPRAGGGLGSDEEASPLELPLGARKVLCDGCHTCTGPVPVTANPHPYANRNSQDMPDTTPTLRHCHNLEIASTPETAVAVARDTQARGPSSTLQNALMPHECVAVGNDGKNFVSKTLQQLMLSRPGSPGPMWQP